MKKQLGLGILLSFIFVVFAVSVAFALPSNRGIDRAKEVSPAIDADSGQVIAPPEFVLGLPESKLSKVVFIRYAPGKEPVCNENGICEPKENHKSCPSDCQKGGGGEEPPEEPSTCYGFLAGSKPHWNWIEDYSYGHTALAGPASFAVSVLEGATSQEIFGSGVFESYSWGKYDQKNSISYGDYDEEGVIGITAIWFRGKNIYEYDIMFDTDYFPGDGSIDLDTVMLHEFGHGAGLDDLYDTACVTEVMYGVYDGVDLDLGPGDTTGIQTLYGP